MVTRRDFLKMAAAAGVGFAAAFGALQTVPSPEESTRQSKPSPHKWVRFLASENETVVRQLVAGEDGRPNLYHLREVIPVQGDAPHLTGGSSIARIETAIPPDTLSDEALYVGGSSVIQFYGVTQNLHYTSEAERQELAKLSLSELEPSEDTTAVLIPIRKSEGWWKLAQDKRQVYFQKTDSHEGHTAIGRPYANRIFRKLYHSRYLNTVLDYDFLTYFEFRHTDEKGFRTLLSELRDIRRNPEWAYVDHEFEIWMTKVG